MTTSLTQRDYSVPHHLVKLQLEVQATRDSVAVLFKGNIVARHVRSQRHGCFSTDANHMPQSHRKHGEWSEQRLRNWAQDIGPNVLAIVDEIFSAKKHPEQAYRSCLGLLNLSKKHDKQRLDNACQRALHIGSIRISSIKSILQQGLDQIELPITSESNQSNNVSNESHSNVRGADYYH